jgi:hypothetical protein
MCGIHINGLGTRANQKVLQNCLNFGRNWRNAGDRAIADFCGYIDKFDVDRIHIWLDTNRSIYIVQDNNAFSTWICIKKQKRTPEQRKEALLKLVLISA